MRVALVVGNPSHHTASAAPVAAELILRGHEVQVLSFCELRGFVVDETRFPDCKVVPVLPAGLRRRSSAGGRQSGSRRDRIVRAAVRAVAASALLPRLVLLLRDADVVLLPNDVAFPYDLVVTACRAHGIPFVLLQEGIRFPLPTEGADAYGTAGAASLCCFGEASARHFDRLGVRREVLRVTGSPRYDAVDLTAAARKGAEARAAFSRPVVLLASNPVDDQGFCTTAQKQELHRSFFRSCPPDVELLVKLHPREDTTAVSRLLAGRGRVLAGVDVWTALALADAVVVMASTVGLEALLLDKPLAVLPLPGHGCVHDYVASGAASQFSSCAELLSDGRAEARRTYVADHLRRGGAAEAVAEAVIDTCVGRAERPKGTSRRRRR